MTDVFQRALIVHVGVLLTTLDIIMCLANDIAATGLNTCVLALVAGLIAFVRQTGIWLLVVRVR